MIYYNNDLTLAQNCYRLPMQNCLNLEPLGDTTVFELCRTRAGDSTIQLLNEADFQLLQPFYYY